MKSWLNRKKLQHRDIVTAALGLALVISNIVWFLCLQDVLHIMDSANNGIFQAMRQNAQLQMCYEKAIKPCPTPVSMPTPAR